MKAWFIRCDGELFGSHPDRALVLARARELRRQGMGVRVGWANAEEWDQPYGFQATRAETVARFQAVIQLLERGEPW